MAWIVRITGWRKGLRKIAMTQAIRRPTGMGLAAAKGLTDRVLDGAVVEIDTPSRESARDLAKELESLGAIAEPWERRVTAPPAPRSGTR